MPLTRHQFYTIALALHITSQIITCRLQLARIVTKSSKLTLNRSQIASTSPQCLETDSHSIQIIVTDPKLRRIVPNRLKLDSRHHRMSHSLSLRPELAAIVTNGYKMIPNRPKMSSHSQIRHHRMSQLLFSRLVNASHAPKIFPTRH